MDVTEITDSELEQERQELHNDIYGHLTVYSTSDLRRHEAVLEEMESRNLGVTAIKHRAEDKNVSPDTLSSREINIEE